MQLLDRMLDGNPRALARLMTLIENRHPAMPAVMQRVYEHAGRARIIGVTGPPGAGKSTLVDRLASGFRGRGDKVGIVAIDPSSPFSGGALLGDRVRMMRHANDPDVFIRSLGSRGSQGGVSRATREVVRLLDAGGYETIIVETVGVGQTELDIMELAHTVLVVLVPESGDTIQTMKAGLTEIADVFLVNKADRDGAERLARELTQMVEISPNRGYRAPVLLTNALRGEGMEPVMEALDRHYTYVRESATWRERQAAANVAEFMEVIIDEIRSRVRGHEARDGFAALLAQVEGGEVNPYVAALLVLREPERLRSLFLVEEIDQPTKENKAT